jgi:hypothetical protein
MGNGETPNSSGLGRDGSERNILKGGEIFRHSFPGNAPVECTHGFIINNDRFVRSMPDTAIYVTMNVIPVHCPRLFDMSFLSFTRTVQSDPIKLWAQW